MILKIVVIKILSYRKMSKDSSAWYHKKTKKKRFKKNLVKNIKIFQKWKKAKKATVWV